MYFHFWSLLTLCYAIPVPFFKTSFHWAEGKNKHTVLLAVSLCCLGTGEWRWQWQLRWRGHGPEGTVLLFHAALWENCTHCYRKGEGPEPTQQSASRAVVFSLQTRDQEQRNLYSSLSAALLCFIFLMSSWKRPRAALLISCGRDESFQKRRCHFWEWFIHIIA